MKHWLIFLGLFVAWLLWIMTGSLAGLLAIVAYVGVVVAVIWSAVAKGGQGWIAGMMFGILLVTLPLWAGYTYVIFQAVFIEAPP